MVSIPSRARSSTAPARFALVLAGGGARGFAHAGVLRTLERWGYEPSVIVGVSMGAVVGTAFASRSDWFEALMGMDTGGFPGPLDRDRPDASKMLSRLHRLYRSARAVGGLVRGWGPGEAAADHGRAVLAKLLGDRSLEDLEIPVAVCATDLRAGRRVVLTSGSATTAVYASAALAGVLPPAMVDGRMLADGAYSDVAPIDVARSFGIPTVIAIDPGQLTPEPRLNNGLQAVVRAMEICHVRHAGLRFESADLVVRPRFQRSIDTLEFSARRECVAAGVRATREAREPLEELLGATWQR